jgi:hypothetical protein
LAVRGFQGVFEFRDFFSMLAASIGELLAEPADQRARRSIDIVSSPDVVCGADRLRRNASTCARSSG